MGPPSHLPDSRQSVREQKRREVPKLFSEVLYKRFELNDNTLLRGKAEAKGFLALSGEKEVQDAPAPQTF